MLNWAKFDLCDLEMTLKGQMKLFHISEQQFPYTASCVCEICN